MSWREQNESWLSWWGREQKLKIAKWFDDRHPDWCWAAMVMWCFGYKDWEIKNQTCTQTEGAYCGKCYLTGRLKEDDHEKD